MATQYIKIRLSFAGRSKEEEDGVVLFNFPVKLCYLWDPPVLLGILQFPMGPSSSPSAFQQVFVHLPTGRGHRFISSGVISCLPIPAGGSERNVRSRANVTSSFPINTWPGFTLPAPGNDTFRTLSSAAPVN